MVISFNLQFKLITWIVFLTLWLGEIIKSNSTSTLSKCLIILIFFSKTFSNNALDASTVKIWYSLVLSLKPIKSKTSSLEKSSTDLFLNSGYLLTSNGWDEISYFISLSMLLIAILALCVWLFNS